MSDTRSSSTGEPLLRIWATTAPARPKEFSLWLDSFRWIAAFIVAICHACGVLAINYARTAHPGYFHKGLSFVAGFAYFAVIVFFVLSGYLVGGAFWSDVVRRKARITHYLVKRLSRLWVVLIPSLALTFALTGLAIAVFPADGHGLLGIDMSGADIAAALSWRTALCNTVFLQYSACAPYGWSIPLWSLAHEFWYYVAFPLFLLGLFQISNKWQASLSLIAGATVLGLVTHFNSWHAPVALYFLLWLLGVAAAVAKRPAIQSATLSAGLFLSVAIALRVVPVVFHYPATAGQFDHGVNYFFPFDLLVAASFANLLLTLKHCQRLYPPPGGALNTRLASFSFSLYCTHFPVIYLVASVCMRVFGIGFHYDGNNIIIALFISIAVTLAIAVSFAFSRITEVHTDTIRAMAVSLLEAQRAPGSIKSPSGATD